MRADKSEGRIRDRRPYWPRRMKLHLAASYLDESETKFLAGVKTGKWPTGTGMAAMCTGSSKTLTPHSIASNLRLRNAVTDGATTLTKIELPYLWAPNGRNKRYWFYRRAGQRIPITSPQGRRLEPGDPGFLEAYERIHESFGLEPSSEPKTGTLAHLIDSYRNAPEFLTLAAKTRKDYARYLDMVKEKHGHRSVAAMPREAVLKLRDEFQGTPRTANYIVSVLRLVLTYAEERKRTFRLPPHWINPARRPKKLKTGEGHRPWEEIEIDGYRKQWMIGTLERVLFEAFLNTGQRGGDVAPMIRQQYFRGEIAVAQEKTKERAGFRHRRTCARHWTLGSKGTITSFYSRPTPDVRCVPTTCAT